MGVNLPELQFTPLDDIPERVSITRQAFLDHKTRDVDIKDHAEQIVEACTKDLNKPVFETETAEIGYLLNDIVLTTRSLHTWVKDEKAHDIDFVFKFTRPKIRKDTLGCVLVIGAFNFPFQLTLGPAIGAIAKGNTVVIKLSEATPRSAALMQTIVERLDPSCYQII
ncbi:hypothetical protein BBP40_001676 [Aspergillus hancockii]|nr:hypothetical protein BBP40_001676 [Aspergillus hancockii]